MPQETEMQKEPPATVLVVDDDPQVREALSLLFESVDLEVQAFKHGEAFLAAELPRGPACIVLDIRMPGMSGMEVQKALIERGSQIPLIMITAHAEVRMAVQALREGAFDFLEKPYSPQTLLDSVQKALQMVRQGHQGQIELQATELLLEKLSSREQEVMELLVGGQTTKAIARKLDLSTKTVEFHRRHILEKMEVSSVVELGRLFERYQNLKKR